MDQGEFVNPDNKQDTFQFRIATFLINILVIGFMLSVIGFWLLKFFRGYMNNECIFKTPLAHMLLVEKDGEIIHASFTRKRLKKTSNPTLFNAQKEIIEYFKGIRKRFTIKINPNGTVYQKKVWQNFYRLNMDIQNTILISQNF